MKAKIFSLLFKGIKKPSDKYVEDIAKELITVVTYYLRGVGEII